MREPIHGHIKGNLNMETKDSLTENQFLLACIAIAIIEVIALHLL